MKHNIGNSLGFLQVAALVAAGSAIDSNSSIVDMAGFEGVIFVQSITDSVITGVATITVETNDVNSDVGMVAAAGAVASAICAANDDLNDRLLVVDVFQPRQRYVQCVRTSAVANIAYGQMFAIRYGAGKQPIVQAVDVAGFASLSSPASV